MREAHVSHTTLNQARTSDRAGNQTYSRKVPFAFCETLKPPVECLGGSSLDRLFPPLGDDEQPDAPGKKKENACIHWHRMGAVALGPDHPARYEPGQARQSHQV